MISRATFRMCIDDIRQTVEWQNKLDDLMYGTCHVPDCVETVLELLSEVCKDDEGWIDYYVFDLNFGEKYQPGMVQVNGSPRALITTDDLYDIVKEHYSVVQ